MFELPTRDALSLLDYLHKVPFRGIKNARAYIGSRTQSCLELGNAGKTALPT